jgi:hypothetical protein
MMAAVCALVLAWEDPDLLEQEALERSPPTAPVVPHVAIDLEPLASVAPLAVSMVHVPLSVVAPFSERLALYAESALTFRPDGWSASGSVGPQLSFGSEALRGFYAIVKFGLLVVERRAPAASPGGPPSLKPSAPVASSRGPLSFEPGLMRAFLFGVDAGWQWTFGRCHVALGIGVSAGYAYGAASLLVGPFQGEQAPTQGFALALNLSLLRVGLVL